MYDPERMDTEFPLVREAHETLSESLRDRNDKILERIYIGIPKESLRERRFRNDTVLPLATQCKRLEILFELYTKMTAK